MAWGFFTHDDDGDHLCIRFCQVCCPPNTPPTFWCAAPPPRTSHLSPLTFLLPLRAVAGCGVAQAMPGAGGLAFYNCGQFSGRSQPHKHLQVRCKSG